MLHTDTVHNKDVNNLIVLLIFDNIFIEYKELEHDVKEANQTKSYAAKTKMEI